ncbi:hypothetical protein [Flavobacterium sp.]|jgi:hypothetical protein|uniref:hypothetical protein n=1 Tax=Flavobacterium sp. TaxID=239 RepID=UPI0037BE2A1F
MKKIFFLNFALLLMVLVLACKNDANRNCNDNFSPDKNYDGYAIIKFQNNFNGSMRYLEAYPVCEASINKKRVIEYSKGNIKDGIVLRVTNNCELWQNLIKDKSISLDEENYGLAFIHIKFNSPNMVEKDFKTFENYLFVHGKKYKVKMFDAGGLCDNIIDYKILQGLNK